MEPFFLTVNQVAAQLQMHSRTVRRLLATGKLPGVKVGGKAWRTPARALIVLLDAQANAREIQAFVEALAGR
jgi:excisionase family DNA binding protein